MEQYNKNNLKFEIIKKGNKKMTNLEQKQIKNFLDSLFPKLTKNKNNFKSVYVENSDDSKVNGFFFKVFVWNKDAFYKIVIEFLFYIQGCENKIEFNKNNKSYLINNYLIGEYI